MFVKKLHREFFLQTALNTTDLPVKVHFPFFTRKEESNKTNREI